MGTPAEEKLLAIMQQDLPDVKIKQASEKVGGEKSVLPAKGGTVPRKRHVKTLTKEEAFRYKIKVMRNLHISHEKIAEALGISVYTIQLYCDKHGIS